MTAVDMFRDALFGNPPVSNHKPSREGALAAFAELAVISYSSGTTLVFATRAGADGLLAYNPGDGSTGARAEVRADPAGDVTDGNGVYRWDGDSWVWISSLVPIAIQNEFDAIADQFFNSVSITADTQSQINSGGFLDFDDDAIGFVHSDPDPLKNGLYKKNGSSGSGGWELTEFRQYSNSLAAVPITAQTFEELEPQIDYDADKLSIVWNDPDPTKNGIYRKVSPSGSGGWQRTAAASSAIAAANSTFEILQLNLNHPAGAVGVVYNDPDPAKIGFYTKSGDAGSGGWLATAFTLEGLVDAADVVNAMVYLPNQVSYIGSLAFGDGLRSLVHTNVDTGQGNTANGIGTLFNLTTGRLNTASGYMTGKAMTALTVNNTYGGTNGNAGNTFYGAYVAVVANGAYDCTLVGTQCGLNLTTGMDLCGFGINTLQMCEAAGETAAFGHGALQYIVGIGSITDIDSTSTTPGVNFSWGHRIAAFGDQAGRYKFDGTTVSNLVRAKKCTYIGAFTKASAEFVINENVFGYGAVGKGSNTCSYGGNDITAHYFNGGPIIAKGTATNDNAAAGMVGEYISAAVINSAPVALVTGNLVNVTSIVLTPGDWDVDASIGFTGNAATTVNYVRGWIARASASVPATTNRMVSRHGFNSALFGSGDINDSVPSERISISTTTTIYLVAQGYFGVNTCSAFGEIKARRIR